MIDVAIFESVFRTLEEIGGAYALYGKVREREGAGSFVAVPHGHFRTKDDKWVAIACTTDRMFERLAQAMERPELASADMYGPRNKRLAAREEVERIAVEWIESYDREEVMRRCLEAQVPCGKLNSIADIFEDEHYQARGTLARVNVPGVGEVVVPNVLPRLSETPGRITNLGPVLGNATAEILGELLGLSWAEIRDLQERKVI